MHDTEAIFTTLNSEIQSVSNAIESIGTEISDLELHKNVIADGVEQLSDFAEQNADYGLAVGNDVQALEDAMSSCREATAKVVEVSEELVGEIQKFQKISIANLKKK